MKIQKDFTFSKKDIENILQNYIEQYHEVEGSKFTFFWENGNSVKVGTNEEVEDLCF